MRRKKNKAKPFLGRLSTRSMFSEKIPGVEFCFLFNRFF